MLPERLIVSGTSPASEPNLALVSEPPSDVSEHVAQLPFTTFAARYCMHRGIKLEDFEETLFRRALYRRARWLRPMLETLRDYFAPDRTFIAMVGRARNMQEIESAMVDFVDCRSRYRFLRKGLKLRVSASTIWAMTHRLLRDQPPPPPMLYRSRPPYPVQSDAWRAGVLTVAGSNLAAARANRGLEEGEVARLQGEVERLNSQCELLKRAVGLFCEPKNPPASLG